MRIAGNESFVFTNDAMLPRVGDKSVLLVGLILGGEEVGTMEILRNEEIYLPLEPIVAFFGCELVETRGDERLELRTPLGNVMLGPEDLYELEAIRYITKTAIEEKLASPVVFDALNFAVRIDLAWQTVDRTRPRGPGKPLEIDAKPPDFALSAIRIEARYSDSTVQGDHYDTNTLVAGRAFGGFWQLRWRDNLEGEQLLEDYAWTRRVGRGVWQFGHQRVHLHPLLTGLEMTGVQHAWTNHDLDLFNRPLRPGELLSRRLGPTDNYEGTGPPAGVAELRIDGRAVSRQIIGLDGRYAFYDVPLSARQQSRIDVYLYERQDLRVPVAIHEAKRNTTEFLLPAGVQVHQGGVGLGGNLVEDALEDRERGPGAAFYQGRYGVNSRLTVEAVAQGTEDRMQYMAGLVSRLTETVMLSFGAAENDEGAGAYLMEVDGRFSDWFFRARSQINEAGFGFQDTEETFDHEIEIGYAASPRFELSLWARKRQQPSTESEYVLPAFAWRPVPRLSLRARPDTDGDYVADLNYRMSRNARFSAHHNEDRTYANLTYRLPNNYRFVLAGESGGALADKATASIHWAGSGRWRPTWTASGIVSRGEAGFRAAATAALFSGLLLRVDYSDDPLTLNNLGRRDRALNIGLISDMTWLGGRLRAGRSRTIGHNRGALAGKIKIDDFDDLDVNGLEGISIRVNGQVGTRTIAGGGFFIGNLKPGVYQVELDPRGLPIELTPVKHKMVVRVVGAAVTRVIFSVRAEYGIAGRVRDDQGQNLAGFRVQLFDADGKLIQTAYTDRFGLYRIDRLPIGRYLLRAAPGNLPETEPDALPTRSVEITGDFLFEQDLTISSQ